MKILNPIRQNLLALNAVSGTSTTDYVRSKFEEVLNSLNIVTLILMTAAGMLAFIVLYNLNNINITERRRELATIKVLGFYDLEVAEYVYRENILLTNYLVPLCGGGIRQVSACVYYYFCRDRGAHVYPSMRTFRAIIYAIIITFGFSNFCQLADVLPTEKNRHG